MNPTKKTGLRGWHFDNSYAQLPARLFTHIQPTPVLSPKLILFNHALADQLGLDSDALESYEGISIFSGNAVPQGSKPIAQAYAGHQFGHFTNLGDGRAVLLGEQITPAGERFDIQLKGSGPTSYSRSGDGRAALGPMLREYMISEAMHALRIPTTRSLAITTSGERVNREKAFAGAVLTRVAQSHIRVGTFEYAAANRNLSLLKSLTDYTIERHYNDLGSPPPHSKAAQEESIYVAFLHAVIKRQAELIAKWQLTGFIHGVMNTDNMAISGETIDYGPCAFMDRYDPKTVFSSIDTRGRYAYGNQPNIAQWNLGRFAETLLPLLHQESEKAIRLAQEAVDGFTLHYYKHWLGGMRQKLGLLHAETEDAPLIEELLHLMEQHKLDFTHTFTALTYDAIEDIPASQLPEFQTWLGTWQDRRNRGKLPQESMASSNPVRIPRNHLVETALAAAVNNEDLAPFKRLMAALSKPYDRVPEYAEYEAPPESTKQQYQTFCGT